MRHICWLLVLICSIGIQNLIAQKMPVSDWGEIPESDLKLTTCSWDTLATAMVLQDVGKIKLFFGDRGAEVIYQRSRRIKIFDPAAFDQGNLRIFYRSNRKEERFEDLDVQLILSDGSRKKVKSDNVFTEEVTEQFNVKKVFIPNLQKGCIIEYRYKLRSSDSQNLYDWFFQEDIPVRWSQVEVSLPEYAEYSVLARKPKEYDLFETRVEKPEMFAAGQHHNRITTYGFSKLPGLTGDEPFMTTVDDYRAHIWFQQDIVQWGATDSIGWGPVALSLSFYQGFGGQYLDSLTNLKIWSSFQASMGQDSIQDSVLIAEKVLRFVGKNIKWDGTFERATPNGVDAAFSKGTGTSADLNLAIVTLLRRYRMKAYPMLLSTRDHGEPITGYPYIYQFNALVAFVIVGKDSLLLDATNPYHAVNQLNPSCYNKMGWVVRIRKPFWTEIRAPEESLTWFGELELDEMGESKGRFSISVTGETAAYWRKQMEESKDKGDFLKKEFAPDYPEAKLDSLVFSNLNDYNKPLQVSFRCSIPNTATVLNDFLYVKPILDFLVLKNPFSSPVRRFPVSFAAALKSQYVLNLTLPKGYLIEELPEKARIVLPGEGGRIQFSCATLENHEVQVLLKMNISKLEFPTEEYGILRQFFDLIAEKTQLQLVLKKG